MVYMADQVDETAYSRLVKQITEIESSASRLEKATADISDSFDRPAAGKTATYKSLLDKINEIERRGRPQQRQQARVQPQPQAVQEQPAPAAAPAQPPHMVQQEELLQQPAPQGTSAKVYAGKELAELTRSLPVHIPRFGVHKLKKVNAADLVLPNLSVADQIAELERILEGINAGAFRGEDFETVRDEVYGLVEQVNREKKKLKSGKPLGEYEYSMLALRDQRIEDAVSVLERMEKEGE